jgi:heme/copper-type cytochrome/quinol oxidase subunit 4
MAATKSQGRAFTLFMAGITATCAGIAFFTTGSGKLACFIGLAVLVISLVYFFKIKSQEGKVANGAQPAVMKLIGVVVVLGGWLFVLYGLHLTASVGGRLVTSILGFLISIAGIFYILAPAVNKNAIWKA